MASAPACMLPVADARGWSARCSGSTLLEFLLLGSAPAPLPRGALFEIRRVLARKRVQWSLPRHRNLLILACERGADLAVVACLLRAFYRQRRLALFDGTHKLLEADREAVLWAAGSAPSSATVSTSSASILARLFLIDNVDFHDRGGQPLHLPVLLAAVRSHDDGWAVAMLLHDRIAPAVAGLTAFGADTEPYATLTGASASHWQLKARREALGYLIECVRCAIKARMHQFLAQLEAVSPLTARAATAYCVARSSTTAERLGETTSHLVKRFYRDLLWRQVGSLVLARMESAHKRKRSVWPIVQAWAWRARTASAAHARAGLLVVLPDAVFRFIVAFLSVEDDAKAVMSALALCDEEDR